MHIDTTRCIQCGSRDRSNAIIFTGEYWFCSEEHYQQTLDKYMKPRYRSDRQAEDDEWIKQRSEEYGDECHQEENNRPVFEQFFGKPRYIHDVIAEKSSQDIALWKRAQAAEIETAKDNLKRIINADDTHQRAEQAEKARIVREKEEEKERIAREKEEEKQRKIDQQEEARDAEEAKWRPRPFKL